MALGEDRENVEIKETKRVRELLRQTAEERETENLKRNERKKKWKSVCEKGNLWN